jgi:hypothetical protein
MYQNVEELDLEEDARGIVGHGGGFGGGFVSTGDLLAFPAHRLDQQSDNRNS